MDNNRNDAPLLFHNIHQQRLCRDRPNLLRVPYANSQPGAILFPSPLIRKGMANCRNFDALFASLGQHTCRILIIFAIIALGGHDVAA